MAKSNPVKAEALAEDVTVAYAGTTYTVSAACLKDLDVLEAFEEGRVLAGMKAILGPTQWATFRATGATADDLNGLVEAIQGALGISGN